MNIDKDTATTVVLSLEAVAGYVAHQAQIFACQSIGAFVQSQERRKRAGLPRDLNTLMDYHPGPYLKELLNEIFSDERGVLNGANLRSTQLLVQDGISDEVAEGIGNQAFRLLTDAIWTTIPNFPFGRVKDTTMEIVGDQFDLEITFYPPRAKV